MGKDKSQKGPDYDQEPGITKTHRRIYKATVWAFVIFAIFWLYGWESLIYDKNDKKIGKSFVFAEEMLYLTNIEDGVMSTKVRDKYESKIVTKKHWETSSAWFPNVNYEEIPCNEVFIVKKAMYVVPHGLLISTFSEGKFKYYVIGSDNFKKTVVAGYEFDFSSREVESKNEEGQCSEGLG